MMVAPKFATERDENYPTRGGIQDQFARVWLRNSFMPFQRHIADVAGELHRDPETGLWIPRRSLVIVTVQRQAGKSHLSMAKNGERCLSVPGFRAWYTAQTGSDARDQFLKFNEEIVLPSPLSKLVTTNVGNGRERMRFANGSTIRPHPPTEEALHGKQSDANDIDEAWAFDELEGQALLQAVGPTQLSRPGAQTWIWSAGGTAASTWLAKLVARGRAGDPAIAYFEWGIPDDADAEDLDVIAEHHPAYGHTITRSSLAALRAQFGDDAAGWARAAGNRWTEVIGGSIDADKWKAARALDPIPEDVPVGYGAARAADGSEVAIVVAADLGTHIVVEVLDVLPTPYKAAEHVAAWAVDGPLAVDRVGPSSSLADDLDNLDGGPELMPLTTGSVTAATANVLDALDVGSAPIRYRRHPSLDAAAEVAGTRRVGDGGKVWARVAAGASIAALEAATLAIWAVGHRPAPTAAPRIYVPRG